MKKRTFRVTMILLALLAGAAFAVGLDDSPCTGEDNECTSAESTCEAGCESSTDECTCESECEDCSCDSLSRAAETSAPIVETVETDCQGCPGHGCH